MNIRRETIVFKDHVSYRAYVTLNDGRKATLETDRELSDEEAAACVPPSQPAVMASSGLTEDAALLDELEGLLNG